MTSAISVQRYNARTAEIHWQRLWERERTGAAAAAPAPPPGFDDVRRWVAADAVARFRRARGDAVVGGGAPADPVLRTLGVVSAEPVTLEPIAGDGSAAPVTTSGDDAAALADAYGADATRWHLLAAPGRRRDHTAAGIHGAWRFVHRLWHLVNAAAAVAGAPLPAAGGTAAAALRTDAHRTIVAVTRHLDSGRFDLAVAAVHTLARLLQGSLAAAAAGDRDLKIAVPEAAEIMVQLFHPMMPHLAESCWAALGHDDRVVARRWPQPCAAAVATVTLAVHVDGRRRGEVAVAHNAATGDIAASVLALAAVRRALAGRAPRKVIVVPQRIINVVA